MFTSVGAAGNAVPKIKVHRFETLLPEEVSLNHPEPVYWLVPNRELNPVEEFKNHFRSHCYAWWNTMPDARYHAHDVTLSQ